MKQIRIGIADDHQLFREGVRTMLNREADMLIIWVAPDGNTVLQKLGQQAVDLLLLDINMPGQSGLEILPQIKDTHPGMHVLMLSMDEDPTRIFQAIRAGADGYLTKDADPVELVKAVRTIMEKGVYYNDQTSKAISFGLQGDQEPDPNVDLKPKEIEVLGYICKGLTAAEIAELIFRSPRTVEGYRQRILEKTGCRNKGDLIAFAIRNKLVD